MAGVYRRRYARQYRKARWVGTKTPTGVPYTDAATASITFTASAVENAQFVEASTATVTFTPSATELYTTQDADTAQVAFTPSAVENAQYVDTGTGLVTFTPSAVENAQFADSGTAQVTFTPSSFEGDLYENFDRTTSGNWSGGPNGPSRVGDWTAALNGAAFSISPNYGSVAMAANTGYRMVAGIAVDNIDWTGSVKVGSIPSAATQQTYLVFRWVDTQNYYRVQINLLTSGQIQMQLQKVVGNVVTNMNSGTLNMTAVGGYTAGDEYNFRIIARGSTITAKMWKQGTSEPAGSTRGNSTTQFWAIDTGTPTDISNGDIGYGGFNGSGNSSITASFGPMSTNISSASGTIYTDAD